MLMQQLFQYHWQKYWIIFLRLYENMHIKLHYFYK